LSCGGTVSFKEHAWAVGGAVFFTRLKRISQFFGVEAASASVTLILSIFHGGFLDWTCRTNSSIHVRYRTAETIVVDTAT
jgi:hypothetical protein